MASNPGSAFGIAINTGDTKTIIDAMVEKRYWSLYFLD